MDVYGHLFPSDTEGLAAKHGVLWRDSQTDKGRIEQALVAVDGKSREEESQGPQRLPVAPSTGIEPATVDPRVRRPQGPMRLVEITALSMMIHESPGATYPCQSPR